MKPTPRRALTSLATAGASAALLLACGGLVSSGLDDNAGSSEDDAASLEDGATNADAASHRPDATLTDAHTETDSSAGDGTVTADATARDGAAAADASRDAGTDATFPAVEGQIALEYGYGSARRRLRTFTNPD